MVVYHTDPVVKLHVATFCKDYKSCTVPARDCTFIYSTALGTCKSAPVEFVVLKCWTVTVDTRAARSVYPKSSDHHRVTKWNTQLICWAWGGGGGGGVGKNNLDLIYYATAPLYSLVPRPRGRPWVQGYSTGMHLKFKVCTVFKIGVMTFGDAVTTLN